MRPLCESFHAVMAIIVMLITIRANHWSFQGENYPSVTCPSPGKTSKCPYYHHQGHSTFLLYSVCVCACVYEANPVTSYCIRRTQPPSVHGDKRAGTKPPRGAAAASFGRAAGFCVQPEDIVCQRGAQLAYLLGPALNEPPLNGPETLAAESGTAVAAVRALLCAVMRVRGGGGAPLSPSHPGDDGEVYEEPDGANVALFFFRLLSPHRSFLAAVGEQTKQSMRGGAAVAALSSAKEDVSLLRTTKTLVYSHRRQSEQKLLLKWPPLTLRLWNS